MTWAGYWNDYVELCYVVSRVLPTNKIPRIDRYHMTVYVLYRCFYIHGMVNLFIFLGNWDILTLLVMADIFFFMIVTLRGLSVMYGVMFLLVLDLVVCIYVMYL